MFKLHSDSTRLFVKESNVVSTFAGAGIVSTLTGVVSTGAGAGVASIGVVPTGVEATGVEAKGDKVGLKETEVD